VERRAAAFVLAVWMSVWSKSLLGNAAASGARLFVKAAAV
jgi:hypothetical protein